jgi:prepilin-type N-terminal cleavage/methylation domain-containing protein
MKSRAGFTLVEMLVVITIIGILTALLLPAVQSARESARRSTCTNNLKQIGLAMQKYEGSTGAFPAATLGFGYDGAPLNSGWMTALLPHLEQPDLYRLYDRSLSWFALSTTDALNVVHSGNLAAVSIRVKVFECPSSPTTERVISGTSASPWLDSNKMTISYTAATTDYVGSGGLMGGMAPNYVTVPAGVDPAVYTMNCGGIALVNGRKITEIPDGTSNTIMVNEMAGRPVYYKAGKADETSTFISSNLNCCGAWAASNYMGFRGFTYDGLVSPGPCGVNAANSRGGIYAFHPSGANSGFADASVHFLSDNIDIAVLVALITRDGHEVIDASQFPGNN